MITHLSRPLSNKEIQALKRRLADKKKHYRADLLGIAASMILGWSIFFVLKFDSIAKDILAIIILVLLLIAVLYIATYQITKRFRAHSTQLKSALEFNTAQETRVTSTDVINFEEIEDEGACYAFQQEHNNILFVCGQNFYPTGSFPSDDFSLISICDADGDLVDLKIINHGVRLEPIRTVSAEAKPHMFFVDNFTLVDGVLKNLDTVLRRFDTKEERILKRLRAAKPLPWIKH